MARAAVKAKQQAQRQAKGGAQPSKSGASRRGGGRRKHAAGGNPNQDLFFMKLRRRAKIVYVLLAVLFAITFAFLGVGSGTNGLDQLFSNINIFGGGGTSVSKAQNYVKDHPASAKGYRDLATAYEAKSNPDGAITALQGYTRIKTKDAKAWTELGGLQLTQAGKLLQDYQNAYTVQQLAAPSTPFLPGGKLGQALGQSPIEQAASQQAGTAVTDLQQRTQLAYNNAVSSYDQAAQLQPKNSAAWFQLAQAAQSAGDAKTAVKGYKQYLKLNPNSASASQIKQLIKQLTASGSG
jgi:DNA-binding SARP family transcriptional activator